MGTGTEPGIPEWGNEITYMYSSTNGYSACSPVQTWPYACLSPQSKYGCIKTVEEIVPEKVIRVVFTDGDIQKAVCSSIDKFSIERGIEVCLCKHMMGGTKEFNKQIKQGLKCFKDLLEAEQEEKEKQKQIALKKEKRAEQKRRRAERKREEQVQIIADAIRQANTENRINRL